MPTTHCCFTWPSNIRKQATSEVPVRNILGDTQEDRNLSFHSNSVPFSSSSRSPNHKCVSNIRATLNTQYSLVLGAREPIQGVVPTKNILGNLPLSIPILAAAPAVLLPHLALAFSIGTNFLPPKSCPALKDLPQCHLRPRVWFRTLLHTTRPWQSNRRRNGSISTSRSPLVASRRHIASIPA
jgi:hypothetical protein